MGRMIPRPFNFEKLDSLDLNEYFELEDAPDGQ